MDVLLVYQCPRPRLKSVRIKAIAIVSPHSKAFMSQQTETQTSVLFSMKSTKADRFPATLLEIEIEGGVIEPSDLKTIAVPDIPGDRGVIISGRAPIWLYSFLTHHYHVCQWVATFDPRLGGAIVTSVHTKNGPSVGDVVSVPKSE